jgi:molybdopterin converting factor small subunit
MQRYSGQREIRMELSPNPNQAIDMIIEHFQIPWKDDLKKSTRIFINKELSDSFIKSGKRLKANDVIAFIPISGGG